MKQGTPSYKSFRDKVRNLDLSPKEFAHSAYRKDGTVMSIAHREIITLAKTSTIKQTADKMSVNRVRRLFITDSKQNLEGMVSATDVVNFLGGGDFFKIVKNRHNGVLESAANEPIRQLMTESPKTIKHTESIQDALIKMHEDNVGSLPIMDGKKIVGVVTERDFANLLAKYYTSEPVSSYMTKDPITGTPGMELDDIAKVMIRNGFRRLPIIEEGKLVGNVSTIDLVSTFAHNPKTEILEWKVSKIMNNAISIAPETTLSDAAEIMRKNSVGGLTVVRGGKLIGIITERDLLKVVSA